MDDPTQGQEAPSAVLEPAQQAADSTSSADAIPLSASDFKPGSSEQETPGEKKSRELFRRLQRDADKRDAELDGDEPAAGQVADSGQDGETQTAAADAGKPADQAPASNGTAQAESQAALSVARDALIRDGWTSADLDKLPKERVLELGGKRRGQQTQQDGFGRQKAEEVAALRAKLAELEGTPAAQAAPAQQQSPAANHADPFADPALAGVGAELDKLGEYASPEVKDVIKKSFATLAQAMGQRIEQHARTSASAQQAIAAAESQMLQASRQVLTKDFPGLSDEGKFSAVTQKMRVLAKTGAYGPGDFQTLMQDAAKLTLPAPTVQDVQRKMLEASRKAQSGQMDAGQGNRANNNGKAVTPDDRMRSALRALKAGKSVDDARRTVRAAS